MIGIYKVTNLVNGKVYIGQSIDIKARFHAHHYDPFHEISHHYNCVFYNAIRKYGIDNFLFEVIEECHSKKLDEREQYWIKYYNSYIRWENCNGYNMTIGGQGNRRFFPEDVLKLWEEGKTTHEIKLILKIGNFAIRKSLETLGVTKEELHERTNDYLYVKVKQYSLKGDFLQNFPSMKEAANYLRKNGHPYARNGNISSACSGAVLTAYGFLWTYEDEEEYVIKERVEKIKTWHPHQKKVNQYSSSGEYIKTFNSIMEAARAMGTNSPAGISKACQGEYRLSKGFAWRYENESPKDKIIISPEKPKKGGRKKKPPKEKAIKPVKKILQYDLEGNFIKQYNSCKEAAEKNGIKYTHFIYRVCSGTRKSCNGYIWKYANKEQKEV